MWTVRGHKALPRTLGGNCALLLMFLCRIAKLLRTMRSHLTSTLLTAIEVRDCTSSCCAGIHEPTPHHQNRAQTPTVGRVWSNYVLLKGLSMPDIDPRHGLQAQRLPHTICGLSKHLMPTSGNLGGSTLCLTPLCSPALLLLITSYAGP